MFYDTYLISSGFLFNFFCVTFLLKLISIIMYNSNSFSFDASRLTSSFHEQLSKTPRWRWCGFWRTLRWMDSPIVQLIRCLKQKKKQISNLYALQFNWKGSRVFMSLLTLKCANTQKTGNILTIGNSIKNRFYIEWRHWPQTLNDLATNIIGKIVFATNFSFYESYNGSS